MKLLYHGFIIFIFLIFLTVFSPQSAFALTTSFRSANIVTTRGVTPYTNLDNCSFTDGLTCDRESGSHYGDLYFRDFGTYTDFGIPEESEITKVRIRVTGKASAGIYVGLSQGTVFQTNCQFPPTLWALSQLAGQTIKTQTFTTGLSQQTNTNGTVLASCLKKYNWF